MRTAFRVLPLLFVLAASAAHAFQIDIARVDTTRPLDELRVGDTFSVDITISNPEARQVIGVGIQAYGWDSSILGATATESVDSLFNSVLIPEPIIPDDPIGAGGATPAGGIINVLSLRPETPAQYTNPLSGLTASNLFQGVTLYPATGTGALDTGIDGASVGTGDAHARVTFQVLGGGSTEITFGALEAHGEMILSFDASVPAVGSADRDFPSTTLRIRASEPIPEPGAGLVFGAGLATIALIGRRRRRD